MIKSLVSKIKWKDLRVIKRLLSMVTLQQEILYKTKSKKANKLKIKLLKRLNKLLLY